MKHLTCLPTDSIQYRCAGCMRKMQQDPRFPHRIMPVLWTPASESQTPLFFVSFTRERYIIFNLRVSSLLAHARCSGLSRTCRNCLHVTHLRCWQDAMSNMCGSGCGCQCRGKTYKPQSDPHAFIVRSPTSSLLSG